MARNILVTPEELESAASRIEELASDYQRQYNSMYRVTDAMGSSWEGTDNKAFINQIAGFKDDLDKMYTLMCNYVDFLRTSAKTYRDTQQAVINEARKLTN